MQRDVPGGETGTRTKDRSEVDQESNSSLININSSDLVMDDNNNWTLLLKLPELLKPNKEVENRVRGVQQQDKQDRSNQETVTTTISPRDNPQETPGETVQLEPWDTTYQI